MNSFVSFVTIMFYFILQK